ncbi:MAG TPA: alpha/beta hydrolase [Candidatus Kapabacteria bacterium]|nr:alpha/beta hydrolase [Candidatus Kapabacteria bacterium]
MRGVFLLAGLLNFLPAAHAANSLYSQAFGLPTNQAVIFLHGGPGYNSASFELSTAQRLADSGFYVIVFDQRGSGRSSTLRGTYKLDEALDDVHEIYRRYGIKQASLIGHSWGGTLGIFFADRYPKYVDRLVLTGSPLSYQHTFKTILRRCTEHYQMLADSSGLRLMHGISQMDTGLLLYSSYLFGEAMKCGLYATPNAASESAELWKRCRVDSLFKYFQDMKQAPVFGFYKTLKYTTLVMSEALRRIVEQLPVRGIYGRDDGLFDADHFAGIRNVIGADNFVTLDNASHGAFLDQPTEFLTQVTRALRD